MYLQLLKMHGTTFAAGCVFAALAQLKTYPSFSIKSAFMYFFLWLALGAVQVMAQLFQWYLVNGIRPWKAFAVFVVVVVAPLGFQFISWPLVAAIYALGVPLMLLALKAPKALIE